MILGFSHYLCYTVCEHPKEMVPLIREAIRQVMLEYYNDRKIAGLPLTLKENVHPRLCEVPLIDTYLKKNVSSLRTTDVGRLVKLLGTVTRTGAVMLREVTREYQCDRCEHVFEVEGDITQRGAFELPGTCPSREDIGSECKSSSFTPVENGKDLVCREYQEIKVQEKVQNLDVGSIPRSIAVILTDDLADTVKPGDDVLVTGILHRRWNKPLYANQRADVTLALEATHVMSNNEQKSFLHITEAITELFKQFWKKHASQPLKGRDFILSSMCPQIHGLYLLKLIMAMSLIGGVSYTDPSGTKIRGESHLLMVGDPGTAKSQLLRYASKLSPRSVLTTGIGTTSAGLTVSAVREATTGDWMLDAGALVLADGGLCCIDEFDGIRQHDRASIHEAMEQQTLSVAKAGLVCTLTTRATVFAAVNPKSSSRVGTDIDVNNVDDNPNVLNDQSGSVPIHLAIASPLLSRFDVVLTLLDQRDEAWDRELSSFILNGYRLPDDDPSAADGEYWDLLRLQQYMYYVKTRIKPTLSSDAQLLLSKYYTMERAAEGRNASRTTVRLLEALVRLTQAHARLLFRSVGIVMDAVFAIAAVEASASGKSVVGSIGSLQSRFPDNPQEQFEKYGKYILVKLGLESQVNIAEDAPLAANDEQVEA
eukprot:Plantae.Rhodophyta-Hildenbrandia_rubra.ctg5401.p1 GENE.Plantae.Rhodophyta-Hildenbrandia_rubra.ctg5401~~Plantae.Rhodophyta-Hildenbrandia_rubra.ctg5401.p1  ORF type:complete len:651 (+),score=105.86 Plantae.Rhodophyta-Hildenbrandia_rubra.ctg5401:3832-5784(+)